MRVIPVRCVRPGSKLGKTIHGEAGNILLKQGIELTQNLLDKLDHNGIYTIYVDDGYSETEIQEIIRPEVRQRAIQSIREVFSQIGKSHSVAVDFSGDLKRQLMLKSMDKYMQALKGVSVYIIEEILQNRSLMVNLVDIKTYDNYMYEHALSVAVLSMILAVEAKTTRNHLQSIFVGALLHDIGKVMLPHSLHAKRDNPDDIDADLLRAHPMLGYEYLKDNRSIDGHAKSIVLQHHEHYDGTGYPRGTSGEYISKMARIVAIANAYDEMTSDTPYSRAVPPNEAIEYLMAEAGSRFDFSLVELFVRKIVPYPPGTLVKVSNGRLAVVNSVRENYPLRPCIRFLDPETGLPELMQIDLMTEKNLVITGVYLEDPRPLAPVQSLAVLSTD